MSRELFLLGLLNHHDMYGYQINEFLGKNLAACTDLKKSTAYFLLGKMAELEWVTEEITQEGNRPPRRVYHLTPAGQLEFLSLLRKNLSSFEPPVFSGDAGLAFLDVLPREEQISLLQERRKALMQALSALEDVPQHAGSLGLVVEHQKIHLDAELAWLDKVIEGQHQAFLSDDHQNKK